MARGQGNCYPTKHRTELSTYISVGLGLRNPALIRDKKILKTKTNKPRIQKVEGKKQQIQIHKKEGNCRENRNQETTMTREKSQNRSWYSGKINKINKPLAGY